MDRNDHESDRAARILNVLGEDGPYKGDVLIRLLYDELRALAAKKVAGDPAAAALDPTSLVHRAYLRLIGDANLAWESRGHFFAAAAEAMRRVLVDRARALAADKHGGGRSREPLDSTIMDLKGAGRADVLDVNEALLRLEQQDSELGSLIKLRFFAGLTMEQTALALNIPPRTLDRRWAAARAWLIAELERMKE